MPKAKTKKKIKIPDPLAVRRRANTSIVKYQSKMLRMSSNSTRTEDTTNYKNTTYPTRLKIDENIENIATPENDNGNEIFHGTNQIPMMSSDLTKTGQTSSKMEESAENFIMPDNYNENETIHQTYEEPMRSSNLTRTDDTTNYKNTTYLTSLEIDENIKSIIIQENDNGNETINETNQVPMMSSNLIRTGFATNYNDTIYPTSSKMEESAENFIKPVNYEYNENETIHQIIEEPVISSDLTRTGFATNYNDPIYPTSSKMEESAENFNMADNYIENQTIYKRNEAPTPNSISNNWKTNQNVTIDDTMNSSNTTYHSSIIENTDENITASESIHETIEQSNVTPIKNKRVTQSICTDHNNKNSALASSFDHECFGKEHTIAQQVDASPTKDSRIVMPSSHDEMTNSSLMGAMEKAYQSTPIKSVSTKSVPCHAHNNFIITSKAEDCGAQLSTNDTKTSFLILSNVVLRAPNILKERNNNIMNVEQQQTPQKQNLIISESDTSPDLVKSFYDSVELPDSPIIKQYLKTSFSKTQQISKQNSVETNTSPDITKCLDESQYSQKEFQDVMTPKTNVKTEIKSNEKLTKTLQKEVTLNSVKESTVNELQEHSLQENEQKIIKDKILKTVQNATHNFEQPSTSYKSRTIRGISENKTVTSKTNDSGRKLRTNACNKSYIDFLSEDEREDFSCGSSDVWSVKESESITDTDTETKEKKYKKRRNTKKGKEKKNEEQITRKRVKPINKEKNRKKAKDCGEKYITRSGNEKDAKSVQPNPCFGGKCGRVCGLLSEERRKAIFDYFWSLDTQRRRDWLVRCVQKIDVKRKKTKAEVSRRTTSYQYLINDGEGHVQVCQQFLLKTLDIGQKFLLYTTQNATEGMGQKDQRKSNVPIKYAEETKNNAKRFIEALPAVPSHYCRKETNRIYLLQEYKNLNNLYRMYSNECEHNKVEKLSEKLFKQLFNTEYNIGFHTPKKDKCTLCTKAEHNSAELTEQEKDELKKHLEEKDATHNRFKTHQNISNRKHTLTVSFDLQKVLNSPSGESVLLYYARKYQLYNLTFYESGTQDAYCFTWGESDAKRGSNEIATCLYNYLKEVDSKGYKILLLYCDACPGQNKNRAVLTAINHFLRTSENVEIVQINYLLPGHSYMPADSVHAIIEREVKNLIVWAPSQWPTYIESARKSPKPYNIRCLEYQDFLDWEQATDKVFTNSTMKQFKMQKLRTATFKKKDYKKMEIKYSAKEENSVKTVQLYEPDGKGKGKGKGKGRPKSTKQNENDTITLKQLYHERLPISAAKYKDLKRLCENGTIPKRFHQEYFSLPNQSNIIDVLPESDVEDQSD